jgi:large subunit ribosomal protein L3
MAEKALIWALFFAFRKSEVQGNIFFTIMAGFLLAEKSETTQMFDEAGNRIPVTYLKSTPCFLIDIKWPQVHGYMSVKLGFGQAKNIKKTVQGQLTKAGIKTPLRFLKEIRIEKMGVTEVEENGKKGIQIGEVKLFVGDEVKPELLFKIGDFVAVSGTSKGKGFQGVVKRHGFAGGPKTHGQSDRLRAPGSMGQSTTPGRVYKGKRMAGHMGQDRVTIQGLKIMNVDANGITVKGLIPGPVHGVLEVRA